MKPHSIVKLACVGALAAFATAASAQETTVIEQHRVVRAPAPPPPAPAPSVVVHKTTTTTSVRATAASPPTRHVVVARRTRRPAAHVVVAQAPPPARVVERSTAVAQAPAPQAGDAVATVDRKTVIHRDENGDVSRHTRIERQDADGTTTVIHHSSETPADPGAPPQQ